MSIVGLLEIQIRLEETRLSQRGEQMSAAKVGFVKHEKAWKLKPTTDSTLSIKLFVSTSSCLIQT